MSTLRDRIKEVKVRCVNNDLSISYEIVCSLEDNLPIDLTRTLKEAQTIIKSINQYYIDLGGRGVKLYVRPIVIDRYTGRLIYRSI